MRKVCLLGASGSIGGQSLDVLRADRLTFQLVGFSLGRQIDKVAAILADFPEAKFVCVGREEDAAALRAVHHGIAFYSGDEGLVELIEGCGCDLVENALVGFVGLLPSLAALRNDKILCLANKESLVVGGSFIKKILASGHGRLYPIDSEHVALAKCLSRVDRSDVERFVITASGGAFRKLGRSELADVTPEMALNHPTWAMGAKITVDSATMMNKGFEVIEACHLFDWPLDKIEILMHDESHVHSLLLMKDGSYWADVSSPDMRNPIKYALYETKTDFEVYHKQRLAEFGDYHFHKFDPDRYPAVGIALKAYRDGGVETAVLNAANEVADQAFLDGKMDFLGIEPECQAALRHLPNTLKPSLRDVLSADAYARLFVKGRIERE